MKIYTRGGDKGKTNIVSGKSIFLMQKYSIRPLILFYPEGTWYRPSVMWPGLWPGGRSVVCGL